MLDRVRMDVEDGLLPSAEIAVARAGRVVNVGLDPAYPAPRMLGSIMRTPRDLHVLLDT